MSRTEPKFQVSKSVQGENCVIESELCSWNAQREDGNAVQDYQSEQGLYPEFNHILSKKGKQAKM
jgi:hypothetical protein